MCNNEITKYPVSTPSKSQWAVGLLHADGSAAPPLPAVGSHSYTLVEATSAAPLVENVPISEETTGRFQFLTGLSRHRLARLVLKLVFIRAGLRRVCSATGLD